MTDTTLQMAAHWHVFAARYAGQTAGQHAWPHPLSEADAQRLADDLARGDVNACPADRPDAVWIHRCPGGCMFLGHSDPFDPDEAEPYWAREAS